MTMARHRGFIGAALGVLAVTATAAAPVRAQTQALDFFGAFTGSSSGNNTLGWIFTVSVPVTVTELGLLDLGNNGFTNTHQIGLWTSGGVLLTSTTIGAGLSGTAVVSGSGLGAFRYVDAPDVALAPGSYVLGASYLLQDADGLAAGANIVNMAAGFSFGNRRFIENAGFTFPANDFPDNGLFGPNLRFVSSAAAAPEPGTLGLAGVAIMGAVAARRRRR